jgi:hypothetical protein
MRAPILAISRWFIRLLNLLMPKSWHKDCRTGIDDCLKGHADNISCYLRYKDTSSGIRFLDLAVSSRHTALDNCDMLGLDLMPYIKRMDDLEISKLGKRICELDKSS